MFTRTEGMDEFVNLRPSMLDRHEWVVPFAETWTDEKLPWATTPAKHSFGKLPEFSAFPALIQAFAQAGRAAGCEGLSGLARSAHISLRSRGCSSREALVEAAP
jgi:hypothetical protein